MAHDPRLVMRVPGYGEAWAEALFERMIGILDPKIARILKPDDRVINLAGQGRCLSLGKIVGGVNQRTVLIDQRYLLPILYYRRGFKGVTEAIVNGHSRLDFPSVRSIHVVGLNQTLIEGGSPYRLQLQIRASTRIGYLRQANETEDL